MAKLIFKTILILLPLLIIIGLFRIAIHGGDYPFLPEYAELVSMFSKAPDFIGILTEEIGNVNSMWLNTQGAYDAMASIEITDIGSFFNAFGAFFVMVGKFFESVGSVLRLLWIAISTPVQLLVWLITNVLGLNVPA